MGFVPRNVTVNGLTRGTSVSLFSSGGALTVGNVEATAGAAALSATGTGANLTAGNVTATGGNIALDAGGRIDAGTVSATGGNVTLSVNAGPISAGALSAVRSGGSGGQIAVSSFVASPISLGNLAATTSITINGGGTLSAGSANAASIAIGRTTAPSSASFSGAVTTGDFFAQVQGALGFGATNSIEAISGLSTGSALSLQNDLTNLTISGLVTAGSNDVTIRNTGDITISATGQVSGRIVALSAGDQFVNLSGSDAVTASQRWAIYSAAPTGNTFGGLDSGNTAVWNSTISTAAPGTLTGNRYVFAFQPTLTVTSTSTSKVYGTDLTGALNGFISVSGLQQGVAGAYLGDTLADVLSGTAAVTSAGSVARASVVGGPYAMTVSQGTLATSRGYSLAFDSAGVLTVTRKPITGSVAVNNKTYDGNRTGTGTVTLNGVVSGDTVGTTGTTFTFADKNAGTGKTVAVAGTTLTGGDAGNYTLTVPASALADILAKAITASVAVNNKTYDGNRTGTGTVTLNGVVSGDTVGTTGTTFTFADKNAGTGKTVAIAGTTLTGGDAGNYTLTVPASALADILARLLIISADNQEKAQGAPDPALTFRIGGEGLVAGESLSGALARVAGELAGDYAITQGNLDAGGNYTLRFEGGTLTILTPPFRQVPLRSQVLPGDVPAPGVSNGIAIDASGVCGEEAGAACQAKQ